MKRLICFFLVLILFVSTLTACSYKVKYPEIYTTEYCIENYVGASGNLIHIRKAENAVGKSAKNPKGMKVSYYAIKDVPLDEYLIQVDVLPFTKSFLIVKNKNKDLPKNEILSYGIEDIKLYRDSTTGTSPVDDYGLERVKEYVASLDKEKIASFQPYLKNCIDTKNCYVPESAVSVLYNGCPLKIRAYFSEYKFLAWDASIMIQDNEYYMSLNFFNEESKWNNLLIPLSQDIIDLIPSDVTFDSYLI